MSVLYGNARFVAKAGRGDELERRLMGVLASTRQEPGNRGAALYRSADQPSIFYVHTVWRDAAALTAHFGRSYVRDFLATGADLQAEPNTVGFGHMISDPGPAVASGPEPRSRLYGIARFVARAGSESELERVLLRLVAPTRAEAGNLGYDLFRSTDNPAFFYVHESWRDAAAVRAHAGQRHARDARDAMENLAAEPVAVGFGELVGDPTTTKE